MTILRNDFVLFLDVNKNSDNWKYFLRFREFKSQIKALPAFNLNDARKLDPDFHRQQLSYWRTQGYIRFLAGFYYILADQAVACT